MKTNNEIHWSKAQQISKQEAIQKKADLEDLARRTQEAKDQMWDAMGSKNFRYSDFEDICYDNDLDEEDLLFELI